MQRKFKFLLTTTVNPTHNCCEFFQDHFLLGALVVITRPGRQKSLATPLQSI